MGGRLESSDRRHGNVAAKADRDVGPEPSQPRLIVPRVDRLVALNAEIGRQRRGIEIAEDDLGLGPARGRVREIDIPERPRFPAKLDQSTQDPACPLRRAGPVNRSSPGDVMRQRDARQSADGGLAYRRHGSGVIDVRSQIAAGVDARKDPARVRCERVERQANAIDGRARHGEALRGFAARSRSADES